MLYEFHLNKKILKMKKKLKCLTVCDGSVHRGKAGFNLNVHPLNG